MIRLTSSYWSHLATSATSYVIFYATATLEGIVCSNDGGIAAHNVLCAYVCYLAFADETVRAHLSQVKIVLFQEMLDAYVQNTNNTRV